MSTCTKCFVFTEKCQVCELEAKNVELEKKLGIAVEALDKISKEEVKDGRYYSMETIGANLAREALEKIKAK